MISRRKSITPKNLEFAINNNNLFAIFCLENTTGTGNGEKKLQQVEPDMIICLKSQEKLTIIYQSFY